MGPDSIIGASVSLALAGINHIDLVDIAVVVPVVLFPVGNLLLSQRDGLANHLSRILVVTILVVTTVIRLLLTNGQRTDNVEVEFEQTTALGLEVVGHRTTEASL